MSIFLPQASALENNMNLSGSVDLHEFQSMSTSSILLSMLASLAESIIPIIVGALVGHKAIQYWHERKNEIATKNSIITDYAQSFKQCNILQDNFVDRVFEAYITFEKGQPQLAMKEYSYSEYNIQGFLRFPSEPAEMPSSKFKSEYKELASEIDKTSHVRSHLYSTLGFYSDSERIMAKLDGIKDLLSKSEIILYKFFNSASADDFLRYRESYFSQSSKIAHEIRSIEPDMAHLRLR